MGVTLPYVVHTCGLCETVICLAHEYMPQSICRRRGFRPYGRVRSTFFARAAAGAD